MTYSALNATLFENNEETLTKGGVMAEQNTVEQVVETVKNIKCNTFVSVASVTEPRMRKTNNPYFGKVTKRSRIAGAIGFDYEQVIINQGLREGNDIDFNFRAQAHKWAVPTDSLNIVTNKQGTKLYLRIKVQANPEKPEYFFDGEPIEKSEIEQFLYQSKKPQTQDVLEKEVVIRMIDFNNITNIRIAGKDIDIIPEPIEHEREERTDTQQVTEPIS